MRTPWPFLVLGLAVSRVSPYPPVVGCPSQPLRASSHVWLSDPVQSLAGTAVNFSARRSMSAAGRPFHVFAPVFALYFSRSVACVGNCSRRLLQRVRLYPKHRGRLGYSRRLRLRYHAFEISCSVYEARAPGCCDAFGIIGWVSRIVALVRRPLR